MPQFDFDYINLGFSGSAKAEESISDYIVSLDMCMFVYDYDHNAPSVEYFAKTHYNMYKKIRNVHLNIPIIMLSRPNKSGVDESINARINIILDTLERGRSEGDNNLLFINGQDILNSHNKDIFNVDNCHPNDFGFYCMAESIAALIGRFF